MKDGQSKSARKPWTLFLTGLILMLSGLLVAHFVQTSNGVSIKQVSYEREDGKTIRGFLYTPVSATADTKAPAILAVHGYINSREVQSGFAIEFARRGYVVLAPDQSGHGYSDPPAFADGFGGPASLAYLRSLDVVDTGNIGLEGHSMGGWAILAAAATYPDSYRSMVLQGSSTGAPFALEGTPNWPRNVSLIYSKFDEFSSFMWGEANAADIGQTEKLKTLFDTQDNVAPGVIYGNLDSGTARVLYQPKVTHPGDHISPTAIGHAVDWFSQTLDGGVSIGADKQIWMFKEAGTAAALIGFVVLLIGAFDLLLAAPYLSRLRVQPTSYAYDARGRRWWGMALASAIIPVVLFYPVFVLVAEVLPASAILPQAITTQVAVWAILTAIILTAIGLLVRGTRATENRQIGPALLISALTVSVVYFATWVASAFFHLDFRIWFVGVKLLSFAQAKTALVYLPLFGIYFSLTLRTLHLGGSVRSDAPWRDYFSNAAILTGGFFVFLVVQYATLFATGTLLFPLLPLETIIMHQFVPLMLIISIISTFTYRRTASVLPSVLINTLFVTWFIVAGQATQYPNIFG